MFKSIIGFFKYFKWNKSVKRLRNSEITIQDFVNINKKQRVFSSTPFGEDREGNNQLWVLSNRENDLKHYPVFLDIDDCQRFLYSIGRVNFLIINGTLADALDSMDAHSLLQELGVVVDPHSTNAVEIDPKIRATE